MDPLSSLGLTSDSIVGYRLGDVVRAHGSEVPELLPCGYLVGDSNIITVSLKGSSPSRPGPRPIRNIPGVLNSHVSGC